MAKPLLGPTRWADDETNNAAPSSGQRSTGWTPGQVAVSSYFNSLAKAYYDWFAYLDAGVFDGNLVVDGDLTVNYNTDLLGTLEVTNIAEFHNISTFYSDIDVRGSVLLPTGGKLKFPERVLGAVCLALDDVEEGTVAGHGTGKSGVQLAAGGGAVVFKLPMVDAQHRLRKIEILVDGNTGGNMSLLAVDTATGSWSTIVGAAGIGYSGGKFTLTPSAPVDGNRVYRLNVQPPSSGVNISVVTVLCYVDSV